MIILIKYPTIPAQKQKIYYNIKKLEEKKKYFSVVLEVNEAEANRLKKICEENNAEVKIIDTLSQKNVLRSLLDVFEKIAEKGIETLGDEDFKIVEEAEKVVSSG